MVESWIQRGFLASRPSKPRIIIGYMFAVVLLLSSCPYTSAQAGILQATHDIPTSGPSRYTTTFRPSSSSTNKTTTATTVHFTDAAFKPTHSRLHLEPSVQPLQGGMMSDKITANTMHATNALPRSATVAVHIENSGSLTTSGHLLNEVSTLVTVQPSSKPLHTNSLAPIAVHSFMLFNSYATSDLMRLTQATTLSKALSQTTKPMSPSALLSNSATLLEQNSQQIEVNYIPMYTSLADSFSSSLLSIHEDTKPSSSSPYIIPSKKSFRTSSFPDFVVTSFSNIASDSTNTAVRPTVIHSIDSSKTVLFDAYSDTDTSAMSLVEFTTIPTTLRTVEVTPVYIEPSPPFVKQSKVNSNIFSNAYSMESYMTTPPLYISFYTSSSNPSTYEQMYSTIDSGTITETTTLFVEHSEARTLLLSVSHSSEPETSLTALPQVSSVVDSILPVTVTEFSTVASTLSILDSRADNIYSTAFLSSTLLEETTLYLSPSVHSQAIVTSTLSSSNVTSIPFPGLPYPTSATQFKSMFNSISLQPSDVFVTSTVFETTTVLPLTKQLTSMWSGPSSSLPFMTKQVHATSTTMMDADDTSLSSSVEIITSNFHSSSIANDTSSEMVFIPPVATRTPSLQSSQMSRLVQTSSVLSTQNLNTLDTDLYITESTLFITIDPSSTVVSPSPSTVRYNSVSPTQTNVLSSSEKFEAPASSLFTFLSPTPSLTPSAILTISTSYLTESTLAISTILPTSSLMMNRTSGILFPPQGGLSSSHFLMLTPTPSMSSKSTAVFPPLPPVVATSSLPPVVATSSLPPVLSSSLAMPTIMPSPTPVVVIVPTGNTLDSSFATMDSWVSFGISLITQPASLDPMAPSFVQEIEGNLVRAYAAGKAEQDQRDQEIRELLDNLNPDNDPLMNKRRRRAVTIDDVTAQVIDISRTAPNLPDATLVFYIVDDGVRVPAGDCQDVMNELGDTELTHFLGVVVNGGATVYENGIPITTPPPPGPDKSYLVWFIPVIVVIGLCLFFCCCCWFYCFCCRVPPSKRQQEEGPMDPETLKMLKFKSKYPYRPYDQTQNQTPRGFDVVKEGLGNPALDMEDESKKANGTVETTSVATTEEPKRNGPKLQKRGESIPYGKVIESSSSDTDSSPYISSLRSMRGDTDNLLKTDGSSRLASRSVSPGSSANLPARKLPSTDLSQKTSTTEENGSKKRKPRNGKQNKASPSKENNEEFKRVYMEAQKEISKILEPEMFAEGTLPKGKRRRSSSKSKRHTTSSSSDEKHANELPETHLSRKPISPESTLDRQESLQDAKRRVHALIDEAFSLVSSNTTPRGNVVAPAPPTQESNTDSPKLSQNSKARASRRHTQTPMAASPPIHEEEEPPLFEKRRYSPSKVKQSETKAGGTPTRVVIVPVTHVPDQAAQSAVWNPYQAEDEMTRLNNESQQAYVPGMTPPPKVAPKPKARRQSPSDLNQVLPPIYNLPETSLHQSKHHHLHNIKNKHSPDGAHSGSETGYYQDGRGPHHKSAQNRTRNAGGDSAPSTPTRTSQYRHHVPPPETDLLSTIAKEQKLGKPINADYDELDVTAVLNASSGKPHGLASAVREELMRLQRRGGGDGDVNGREIGPL